MKLGESPGLVRIRFMSISALAATIRECGLYELKNIRNIILQCAKVCFRDKGLANLRVPLQKNAKGMYRMSSNKQKHAITKKNRLQVGKW